MTVAVQRPLKGSRLSSFYPIKSLPSLSSLDSAFQLQEYISLLIRLDVHDVERIVSIPEKPGAYQPQSTAFEPDESKLDDKEAEKDNKGEVTVDQACWIYEQLRRLAQDLSHPLITMLQQECTRQSCPEMKAGEWQYLCVAHGNDGAMEQCCAIDYIIHTLDSATALLNSPRAFPSRLSIPTSSYRHFSSLARRLGRIFAHAYFHHREAFEQAEAESSLYARFLMLTSKFDLVPSEFLVIPPRLGHMEDPGRTEEVEPPRLLAAAVDPQRDRERERGRQESKDQKLTGDEPRHNDNVARPESTLSLAGSDGPRKLGRSRTDTMVFSEAVNIPEDIPRLDVSESSAESSSKPSEQVPDFIDSPVDIASPPSEELGQEQDRNDEQPETIPNTDATHATENAIGPDPFVSSDLESGPHEELPTPALTVTEDDAHVSLQPVEEDPEKNGPAENISPEITSSIESIPYHPESSAEDRMEALTMSIPLHFGSSTGDRPEMEALFVDVSKPSEPEVPVPLPEQADLVGGLPVESEDSYTTIDKEEDEVIQQLSHSEVSNVVFEPVIPTEDLEGVPPELSAEDMDAALADADLGLAEENPTL